MRCDTIWRNARLATLAGAGNVSDGIVVAREGRIVFAGPSADARKFDAKMEVDCCGRWITPGLIDCHTHLVYAGDRSAEFELRLSGASYEEIAKRGGGIASTVAATRLAGEDQLVCAALPRLDALIAEGTTAVEVKSGYGLTLDDEIKILRAARRLGQERKVSIIPTFLGAHTVPAEYASDPDAYVALVCDEMIPAIARAGHSVVVDAFCERVGFSIEQTERIFQAAQRHGMRVKLHAEQLSNSQGAALAARYGALSADHLEYLDADGVRAMAQSGTAAVLLPGAFYFMRETRLPPIQALRDAGVPIAIATDSNPGTSPLTSLLLTMNMAATLFRLTVEECLAGVTKNAAAALGLRGDLGTLEAGKWCDLAIWNIERLAELPYHIGRNPLHARVWRGM